MGVKKWIISWLHLLKLYAKMDLVWLVNDTKISVMYILSDSAISMSSVVAMLLLAGRLADVTGFSQAELYFMLGVALLVNGVYDLLLMSNNAGAISRVIGRGQLDHALLQPVPLALHLSAHGFAPVTGSGPLVCGIAFTVWAASRLPGGWWLLLKLLPFVLLSFFIYAAWVFAISALAFWAPYAAEEIAPDVREMFTSLAPYPLTMLTPVVRLLLCTVLPVGAMAWLPASALLGKTQAGPALGLLAATAAVSVLLATLLFRKGLNHYAKVSSPRYSGFGR